MPDHEHAVSVDQDAERDLYERVVEAFPDALIEDPGLTDETRPLFDGVENVAERVTWDSPIRSVGTVADLPWEAEWLNVKPLQFGSVESLLDTLDYCREHVHAFASLCYPDAPNDVALSAYNEPDLGGDLPTSPLSPSTDPQGLDWH